MNSTAILLSWAIPNISEGLIVTQYNLECRNSIMNDTQYLTAFEQTGVITSLTPYTSYTCHVAIVEEDVTHPFSTLTVTVQTDQAGILIYWL